MVGSERPVPDVFEDGVGIGVSFPLWVDPIEVAVETPEGVREVASDGVGLRTLDVCPGVDGPGLRGVGGLEFVESPPVRLRELLAVVVLVRAEEEPRDALAGRILDALEALPSEALVDRPVLVRFEQRLLDGDRVVGGVRQRVDDAC